MHSTKFIHLSLIILALAILSPIPTLLQNRSSASNNITNTHQSPIPTSIKKSPAIDLPSQEDSSSTNKNPSTSPISVDKLPSQQDSSDTNKKTDISPNLIENSQQTLTRKNNKLVDLSKISPNIRQDIRYATSNNFMKRKLYPVSRCLLHEKVAQQLKQVQIELEKDNLGLKVFDCYRPLSIQKQMWKILPNNNYVANPAQGSRHNRASAVDLTLVDLRSGKNKEMPSDYDEFSKRAHLDYEFASIEAKRNRKHLRVVMEKNGFTGIATEWWHYDSADWKKYPLLDISWN
jgi:zinc D-Ala-D-Ala dipeptidase